jgi:hypothetical protein
MSRNEPMHNWRIAKRLVLALAMLFLLLAGGCMPQPQLGARPAENIMDAAEAYLRKYQPGPEPRLFQTLAPTIETGTAGRALGRGSQDVDAAEPHLETPDRRHHRDGGFTFYTNYGVDPMRVGAAPELRRRRNRRRCRTITMQLAQSLLRPGSAL